MMTSINNQAIKGQDIFQRLLFGLIFSNIVFQVLYFGVLVLILVSLMVDFFVCVDRIIIN